MITVSSRGIALTSPWPNLDTALPGRCDRDSPASSIFTMSPTTPYTSTVMPIATITRMIRRDTNGSSTTSFSEMTMISADRMKSVRTAPDTMVFSSGIASSPAAESSWWPPLILCHTFSAPS